MKYAIGNILKKSLKDKIFKNITYKEIRDAFKKIENDVPIASECSTFDIATLATNLFFKEIKKEAFKYVELKNPRRSHIAKLIRDFQSNSKNFKDLEIGQYIEYSINIIDILISENMIEKAEEDEHYKLKRKGHDLRMQNALKRIPLERAEKIIVKLINSVKEYNNNDFNPYKIDEIYVYGSVQRHSLEVGDIDIAYNYSHNILEGEDYDNYLERVTSHFDASVRDFLDGKLKKEMNKSLLVSSYISATDFLQLESLMETEAKASLLYKENKNTKMRIKVDNYQFKTIEASIDYKNEPSSSIIHSFSNPKMEKFQWTPTPFKIDKK